jgi:predicted ester cyclase
MGGTARSRTPLDGTALMSVTATRRIARRFFDVWHWDLSAIDELADPELSVRYPLLPREVHGPQEYKHVLSMIHQHFPDFTFRADEPIVDGNRAVVEWSGGGTHSGRLLGVEATGRQLRFGGVSIYLIRDGKVLREHGHEDVYTLFTQMGVI